MNLGSELGSSAGEDLSRRMCRYKISDMGQIIRMYMPDLPLKASVELPKAISRAYEQLHPK